MTHLSEIQDQFMLALQQQQASALLDKIKDQGGLSSEFRIHLYQYAYAQRLKETIETDHQILGYFLGDDLFDQMVSEYIKEYPSDQSSLRYFSEKLPLFLETSQPFNKYPIIADLARFERLLLTVFDAPDARTVTVESLVKTEPERWPQLTFKFHPSVHLYYTNWNTVEVWQSLKQNQTPETAKSTPSHWLIWRNSERLTEFNSLTANELLIFNAFSQGFDYEHVCEQLASTIAEQDVSEFSINCIVNWLNNDIISSITAST